MEKTIEKMFGLCGLNAIVTGAAQGMGKSMAEALLEAGARVALVDYSKKVEDTCFELDAGGKMALPFVADLSKRDEIDEVFQKIMASFDSKLDILINNAGITKRHKPEEFPREDWDAVMAVNLNAVWFLSQLAGRVMILQKRGKIINMASMCSFFGGSTIPAYTASKGAVAQLTKSLSNDWAGYGINVNALAPGYMDTSLNTALVGNPDREPKILDRIPVGRWGTPEDMKGVAVFLASHASDYITGAVIPVDGGYLGA